MGAGASEAGAVRHDVARLAREGDVLPDCEVLPEPQAIGRDARVSAADH